MFPGGGQWCQPDGTSSGSLAICPGGVRGVREEPRHACAFPTSPLKTAVEKPPVFVLLTMTRTSMYLTDQDGFSRGICRPVVHKAGIQLEAVASVLEWHVLVWCGKLSSCPEYPRLG